MPNITVVKSQKDGVSISSLNLGYGDIVLNATPSEGFNARVSNKTVTIKESADYIKPTSPAQQAFDNITSISAATSRGLYISKVNGILGQEGAMTVVGGNTTDVYPAKNGLIIDDWGRPDIDCDDYAELNNAIHVIDDFLLNIKTQIIGTPTSRDGRADIYGVHKQYQALSDLWNNLVHTAAIKTNVSYQNKQLFVQISITNITDHEIEYIDPNTPLAFWISFNRLPDSKDIPNEELFIHYIRNNAYMSSGKWFELKVSDSTLEDTYKLLEAAYRFPIFGITIPKGDTLTIQMQFALSTTMPPNEDDIVYTGSLTNTGESRVTLIHRLPTTRPASNTNFEYYYDYPNTPSPSAPSTGRVIFKLNSSYQPLPEDAGTYIVEMTDEKGSYVVTKNAVSVSSVNAFQIKPSGAFLKGDKFFTTLVVEEKEQEVLPIKRDSFITEVDIYNIYLSADVKGNLSKKRIVHVTEEENTVGVLSANIRPSVNVAGMRLDGGRLDQGEISVGSVHIGSVNVGSVSIGSVSIGSIKVGSVAVGSISIGSVSVGSVRVGSISIGSTSVGTVSIGSMYFGSVSIGSISIGSIYTGSVIAGSIYVNSIIMGSVYGGSISVGEITVSSISFGEITYGSIIVTWSVTPASICYRSTVIEVVASRTDS